MDTACSPRISAPASVCAEVRERLHVRSYRRITNCDQTQQLGTYVSGRGNQQQHDNTSAPGTRCSHAFERHFFRHYPPQLRPSAARGRFRDQDRPMIDDTSVSIFPDRQAEKEKRKRRGRDGKERKKCGNFVCLPLHPFFELGAFVSRSYGHFAFIPLGVCTNGWVLRIKFRDTRSHPKRLCRFAVFQ